MTARQHPAQADITEIDAQIEAEIAPFADAAARLNEIRSVGLFAAHTIIAGIGLDMNRFPRSRALVLLGQAPHPEGIRRHEEGLELHWPRQPLPGRVLGEAAVAPARPLSWASATAASPAAAARRKQSSQSALHPGHRLTPAI
jgi:hypothetical protein